jgi:chemotaxis family two-component system response regulator Rcp1
MELTDDFAGMSIEAQDRRPEPARKADRARVGRGCGESGGAQKDGAASEYHLYCTWAGASGSSATQLCFRYRARQITQLIKYVYANNFFRYTETGKMLTLSHKSLYAQRFLERPARVDRFDRPLEILVVEDSREDVLLAKTALSHWTLPHRLHVAFDAEEALDFIGRLNEHKDAPRADLVLLDLYLGRIPGFVVLTTIKENTELREIPVVVLSSSGAENDIQAAYNLRADAYLMKGEDYAMHMQLFRRIEAVWLNDAPLSFDGFDSRKDAWEQR